MAKSKREYIYGINSASEVIKSGNRMIYKAFIDTEHLENHRLKQLIEILESKSIYVEEVDLPRLTELAKSKDHQGIVLKTGTYPYKDSKDLWNSPRILLLDSVQDPHNVGGILRSAEIFGFHTILLSNKGVPDIYPSVVSVSSGATEFLDIAKDGSPIEYVTMAKENGYQILALDMNGTLEIREIPENPGEKILLIIGGEDSGISQDVLNLADYVVFIRQQGQINSLNASVAAAIALFSLQSFNSK